ncbi:MAG: hypothetical protein LWX02_05655 [Deltaproteobacteria bacterium]|jgi:hypothetical protein|nr:hypothetical protein [Deltaproteobacteria bacterium]MDL1987632.1 hypothetical protein [Deltaproteobacteria bacterium]MDL1987639.1 hypothetical protein [Deltaproteobacteria bacterium]
MMKKTILVGLLMVALSLPSIGWAATVGNIAETQGALGKFSLGLEYDEVFDRDMDWKSGSLAATALGVTVSFPLPLPVDSIDDMEIDSNRIFLKGTLGLHPNVDMFVKLGMASANWEAKYGEKLEFEDDWDFAWGVGAKVKIFETPGGLRFLGDAQYLRYKVDGDFKIDGKDVDQELLEELRLVDPSATFSSDSETKIEEWQVALYVNQTFGNFSPYAGVKYSDFEIDSELEGSGQLWGIPYSLKLQGDAEADDNFGIFLGTDIYLIPNLLSINIEARFIDETAGTFGLTYRF